MDLKTGEQVSQRRLILHVIDELKMGGAQVHLLILLKESQRAYPQIDHRVITLFGGEHFVDQIRSLGIPVDVLDLRKDLAEKGFFRVLNRLRKEMRRVRPDLVEAHLTMSRLLALPAAFLAGVPQRIGFEQGDIYLNSWKWRLANFVGQVFADSIIVCSQVLKNWVRRTHGTSGQRLKVFYNCVDTRTFGAFKKSSFTSADLFKEKELTIFCAVGSLGLGVNKRMDLCVQALAQLRQKGHRAGLIICGDGPQRQVLQEEASALGVSDFVKFLGIRNDVDQVMAASAAFCHAAPFEPFGIVCIEAMWMGLPALVPDTGGIAEIVENGINGYVYPHLNASALAERMSRICQDPKSARQMGEKGKSKVMKTFSAESYLERLYRLYGFVS